MLGGFHPKKTRPNADVDVVSATEALPKEMPPMPTQPQGVTRGVARTSRQHADHASLTMWMCLAFYWMWLFRGHPKTAGFPFAFTTYFG